MSKFQRSHLMFALVAVLVVVLALAGSSLMAVDKAPAKSGCNMEAGAGCCGAQSETKANCCVDGCDKCTDCADGCKTCTGCADGCAANTCCADGCANCAGCADGCDKCANCAKAECCKGEATAKGDGGKCH